NASIAIFVLYARDVLNVPAAWYGVLLTAAAVGGIVMGWRARPLTRSLSYRQMMAAASVAQGLAWTGIVAAANVWVTAVLLGRVVSASRLFGLGGAGLGALAGGAVAAIYGLTAAFILSASILALGAILTWPYKRR